jgi:hypothetical protein
VAIMMSFYTGKQLAEQKDSQSNVHVPMVYEQVPVEPAHWEYRVLTVDPREEDLPDAVQLNELGAQGWLLVGVLEQGATGGNWSSEEEQMTRDYVSRVLEQSAKGKSSRVHYYFVRQKNG